MGGAGDNRAADHQAAGFDGGHGDAWVAVPPTSGLLAKPEGRLDPNDMIAKMVELIPDQNGPFRNIFPEASQKWFRNTKRQCSNELTEGWRRRWGGPSGAGGNVITALRT